MSWEPINLRDVPDEPPEPPELSGLVYRGRRHWWSGPPESCKTLLAYWCVLEALRSGKWRGVAVIDFEMGERDAKARFRELGATDDELGRIGFYEPETKPEPADMAALAERAELVMLDAAAGAFDLAGLDENRDAERFNSMFVTPLWKAGVTTIVLDHVVKDPDARGMYASGHHRKIGGTDVHLGFEATVALRRGGSGYVKVTVKKDRPGFHRKHVGTIELHSDETTHAITWAWKAEPGQQQDADDEAGDGWRPIGYMEKVSRYLEHHDGNRNTIFEMIGGTKTYVLQAVGYLIADGYAAELEPGKKGTPVRSLKPYREADQDAEPNENGSGMVRGAIVATSGTMVRDAQSPAIPVPMPDAANGSDGSGMVRQRFGEPLFADGSDGSVPPTGGNRNPEPSGEGPATANGEQATDARADELGLDDGVEVPADELEPELRDELVSSGAVSAAVLAGDLEPGTGLDELLAEHEAELADTGGLDLEALAEATGLTVAEVAERRAKAGR